MTETVNYLIISLGAEKAFDKNTTLGLQGIYLKIRESIYNKPTENIHLLGDKFKVLPLKSGASKRRLSTLFIQI